MWHGIHASGTRRSPLSHRCELPAAPAPGSLRATWLGVSTVLLDDGETAVLTDGFFSRPGRLRVIAGRMRPDRGRIDRALDRAGIRQLAAVFVVHSHYDHALDAPTVAALTGARLLGSASTRNVARGNGFPDDRFDLVTPGEPRVFGRFTLTALLSRHSPGDLARGRIDEPIPAAARASAFRTGDCYSLHVRHDERALLVHASADAKPGALTGHDADVAYLGIGLLGRRDDAFRERYWNETVGATGARRIVPIHWDDFTRDLDRPVRRLPWPLDDVPGALDWLQRRADAAGTTLTLPVPWQRTDPWSPA